MWLQANMEPLMYTIPRGGGFVNPALVATTVAFHNGDDIYVYIYRCNYVYIISYMEKGFGVVTRNRHYIPNGKAQLKLNGNWGTSVGNCKISVAGTCRSPSLGLSVERVNSSSPKSQEGKITPTAPPVNPCSQSRLNWHVAHQHVWKIDTSLSRPTGDS